jgi:hypothetical protein
MTIRQFSMSVAAALALGIAGAGHAAAKITSFDPSGSAGTFPDGINDAGTITGYYKNQSDIYHGFLRTSGGTITSFDVSGVSDTSPYAINDKGAIVGDDFDGSYIHGFVRATDGTITTFDVTSGRNTQSVAISDKSDVAGSYEDAITTAIHGFVRAVNGTITSFDPTGSNFSFPVGVNDSGVTTGAYVDKSNVYHGFVRTKDGTITSFDPSGSVSTSSSASTTRGWRSVPMAIQATCSTALSACRTGRSRCSIPPAQATRLPMRLTTKATLPAGTATQTM